MPEAAAHAAAAAPSKKRQQAEEAIAAAVADALHLLGALKQWLPLLSSEWQGAGRGCCYVLPHWLCPWLQQRRLLLSPTCIACLHAALCTCWPSGDGPVMTLVV